ncbi:Uncharacterised protein [Pseudomonas aeruginosa]|nr:Uncharacterised protein [Pseudomonas aeruginosa]
MSRAVELARPAVGGQVACWRARCRRAFRRPGTVRRRAGARPGWPAGSRPVRVTWAGTVPPPSPGAHRRAGVEAAAAGESGRPSCACSPACQLQPWASGSSASRSSAGRPASSSRRRRRGGAGAAALHCVGPCGLRKKWEILTGLGLAYPPWIVGDGSAVHPCRGFLMRRFSRHSPTRSARPAFHGLWRFPPTWPTMRLPRLADCPRR